MTLVTKRTKEYQIWPGGSAHVLVQFVGDNNTYDIRVKEPNREDPKAPVIKPDRKLVAEKIREFKPRAEEIRAKQQETEELPALDGEGRLMRRHLGPNRRRTR